MRVKEILCLAAELVGEDVAGSVQSYIQDGDEKGKQVTDELLGCFNSVQYQLASEYLPIRTEEKIETDTGAVPYKSLSKKALRIVKVTNEWDMPIRVDEYGDYFKAQMGVLKVTYTYLPSDCGLDDEAVVHPAVSARLCAYGTVAEYCTRVGLYEEAGVWEKKYKSAVAAAYRKTPCRKIPQRAWR